MYKWANRGHEQKNESARSGFILDRLVGPNTIADRWWGSLTFRWPNSTLRSANLKIFKNINIFCFHRPNVFTAISGWLEVRLLWSCVDWVLRWRFSAHDENFLSNLLLVHRFLDPSTMGQMAMNRMANKEEIKCWMDAHWVILVPINGPGGAPRA